MVSLTFDEFHAIRSRQRATAEAKAGTTAAAVSAKASKDVAPSAYLSSDKAAGSMKAAAAKGAFRFSPLRSPASSPGRSDDSDEFAPTSGSVIRKTNINHHHHQQRPQHLKPPQHRQQQGNKQGERRVFESGWVSALGKGSAANLGRFVELYEVQIVIVAMIYLDLVASTAQLLPYFRTPDGGAADGAGEVEGVPAGSAGAGFGAFVVRLVSRFMQSFTGFTVIFFAIEVVMLLVAFRGKFFRHLGYVIDLLVVSACLYQELAGKGKGVRLLGALRVWRVARVMNTLLLSADEAHDETKDTLRLAEQSTREIDTDRRRLQETLRREVEARKRVDKMLRGYKDEVETLNEALKIAAMDIATAGVSPGMDMSNDNEIPKRSQPPAESDTGSSNNSSGEGAGGAGRPKKQQQQQQQQSSSSSTGTANRIFVFQDGTFQAR